MPQTLTLNLQKRWHHFFSIFPSFLRLLACARYITGNDNDEKNYSIDANKVFVNTSPSLKEDLKKNIENSMTVLAVMQKPRRENENIRALIDILIGLKTKLPLKVNLGQAILS